MNDQVRDLINRGASTEVIRDLALRTGMVPLRNSGLEKSLRRHTPSRKWSAKR